MTTYTTYDQVGIAEDVSDVISNITPTKVPFQNLIKEEKTTSRLFEWQEDSLRDVQDNAQVEGFDATEATLTPTVMRDNVTQIFEKTIKVSLTSDAVKTHGRAKETAYQLAKAGKELVRDFEYALVGKVTAKTAGASDTARKFASAFSQIDDDVTITTPDGDSGTGGTQPGPLTEANLLAAHEAAYDEGADPSILLIKPKDSLIVANFAAASGRNREINNGTKDRAIINAVDLYVSPFGELKVVLDRFIKSTEALLIDPDMWKKVVLSNWNRTKLAQTGDNEKHMIVGEFSLKHVNFKGSARITNLS
jgi:hypothetical protein